MTSPFRVLIDRPTLLTRVDEIADAIGRTITDQPPVLVAVIEGARVFARELARRLPIQLPVHPIRAASYGNALTSSGNVQIIGGTDIDVRECTVYLLEDIVDTGRTMDRLRAFFFERGATDVIVVTLLSKPCRRVVDVPLGHVGFEIQDHFVVGFGMDVGGRFRELPEVVLYDAALERQAAEG